jgi:hypothetical protein
MPKKWRVRSEFVIEAPDQQTAAEALLDAVHKEIPGAEMVECTTCADEDIADARLTVEGGQSLKEHFDAFQDFRKEKKQSEQDSGRPKRFLPLRGNDEQ